MKTTIGTMITMTKVTVPKRAHDAFLKYFEEEKGAINIFTTSEEISIAIASPCEIIDRNDGTETMLIFGDWEHQLLTYKEECIIKIEVLDTFFSSKIKI